jgi:hypothetical protein
MRYFNCDVSDTSIKIERQMFMEQVMAYLILLENSNDMALRPRIERPGRRAMNGTTWPNSHESKHLAPRPWIECPRLAHASAKGI